MENISCFQYTNMIFESKQSPVSLPSVLEGLVGILIVWNLDKLHVYNLHCKLHHQVLEPKITKFPNHIGWFLYPIFCYYNWTSRNDNDFTVVDWIECCFEYWKCYHHRSCSLDFSRFLCIRFLVAKYKLYCKNVIDLLAIRNGSNWR